mmetsp:Transcript_40771/g.122833  ORF Transcript_40771/g.122833 Transcript_40771/m.122833 type:complete len:81 (-) Transcript_40771:617-859(-)
MHSWLFFPLHIISPANASVQAMNKAVMKIRRTTNEVRNVQCRPRLIHLLKSQQQVGHPDISEKSLACCTQQNRRHPLVIF